MAGEFGKFIDSKRKGRGSGGDDIKLKDIADAMGMTASYLSDIVKGRRNPPEIHILEKIAAVLQLTSDEKEEMLDLAGRDRDSAAPDLPEYLMSTQLPHVRKALRRATEKNLGDAFWKKVCEEINKQDEEQ
ncbi:MAG TPA: helix-turn-helix transcriptional regulator [Caldisericia bacterium]|jgi:transcriptional regulator with XRE-family HTH domain|uniref:helix-turn-helix domain-containing protein n=1 Tax=Dehalococcoides sp. THU4 TaxID=3348344 RepID=UPI002BF23CF0|nr:helix-turn-helix transcriptional regulator [Caldisericia bacterium]